MNTFFSAIYCGIITFEACIVILMLIAALTPLHKWLLPSFLNYVGFVYVTKLDVLTGWIISTTCVVTIWWLSGLSVGWLLVSFGLDVISVPATLWLIEISRYNPAESETLAG